MLLVDGIEEWLVQSAVELEGVKSELHGVIEKQKCQGTLTVSGGYRLVERKRS